MSLHFTREEVFIPVIEMIQGVSTAVFLGTGAGAPVTVSETVAGGDVPGISMAADDDEVAFLMPRKLSGIVVEHDIDLILLISAATATSATDSIDVALTYLEMTPASTKLTASAVATGVTDFTRYVQPGVAQRDTIIEMAGGKIAGGTLTTRDAWLKLILTATLNPEGNAGYIANECRILGCLVAYTSIAERLDQFQVKRQTTATKPGLVDPGGVSLTP